MQNVFKIFVGVIGIVAFSSGCAQTKFGTDHSEVTLASTASPNEDSDALEDTAGDQPSQSKLSCIKGEMDGTSLNCLFNSGYAIRTAQSPNKTIGVFLAPYDVVKIPKCDGDDVESCLAALNSLISLTCSNSQIRKEWGLTGSSSQAKIFKSAAASEAYLLSINTIGISNAIANGGRGNLQMRLKSGQLVDTQIRHVVCL